MYSYKGFRTRNYETCLFCFNHARPNRGYFKSLVPVISFRDCDSFTPLPNLANSSQRKTRKKENKTKRNPIAKRTNTILLNRLRPKSQHQPLFSHTHTHAHTHIHTHFTTSSLTNLVVLRQLFVGAVSFRNVELLSEQLSVFKLSGSHRKDLF